MVMMMSFVLNKVNAENGNADLDPLQCFLSCFLSNGNLSRSFNLFLSLPIYFYAIYELSTIRSTKGENT
jgi:hypothetical protein